MRIYTESHGIVTEQRRKFEVKYHRWSIGNNLIRHRLGKSYNRGWPRKISTVRPRRWGDRGDLSFQRVWILVNCDVSQSDSIRFHREISPRTEKQERRRRRLGLSNKLNVDETAPFLSFLSCVYACMYICVRVRACVLSRTMVRTKSGPTRSDVEISGQIALRKLAGVHIVRLLFISRKFRRQIYSSRWATVERTEDDGARNVRRHFDGVSARLPSPWTRYRGCCRKR